MSVFTPEEKKQLESFLLLVGKIIQLELFKNGLPPARMSYKISQDSYEKKLELPSEELLRSALLDLRKVYAKKESTNFCKISRLSLEKVEDQAIIEETQNILNAYDLCLKQSDFKIIINGEAVTPMEALKLWFYGHYFHEVGSIKDKLFYQYANFTYEIKFQFFIAVRELAKFAVRLSKIVKKVIEL
jgi:hypothetical protein